MTPADLLVCPYDAALGSQLSGRPPGRVVIDFGESSLESADLDPLSAQHRALRDAGWSLAYAAARSGTRGALIVALHRIDDIQTVVVPSVSQATAALEEGQHRLRDALRSLGLDGIEPAMQPSTWQTRTMAKGFNWLASLQNGYKTPFVETMLRTYGVSAMPQLGPALEGALDALTAEHGECHAQAIVAFAALGNGCPFCSYGHLYAADLLYFEETGSLGPIDPDDLLQARGWLDAQVSDWVEAQLVGPVWAPIAASILRVQALRGGAEPTEQQDALLLQVLSAWRLINECSLQHPVKTAPPLHPRMARARRLQRDYRAARAAQRA